MTGTRVGLALCWISISLGSFAGARGQGLAPKVDAAAFRRAEHLQHGINASIWFAQSPRDYTVERLRSFTTDEDIRLMRRLGFDHVRLSIDATPLIEWQRSRDGVTPFMAELDRVVKEITVEGMAVVVDVHPEGDYKKTLLLGSSGVERFVSLWSAVAKHFAAMDPEMVFFEVMNEPEQDDPLRWQGIQAMAAREIRRVAPRHTIIATGAHYSGLKDLMVLEPLAMDDVIYTFHDYEPFAFTHQGATWTDPAVAPLRGVPYPSTRENIVRNEEQEPTLAGRYFVAEYGQARWDAARVDASVGFAERWSKEFGVPVYCGEFGVHRPYAEAKARAQWIGDMRVALERHHIGWAMWDYQTNFGAVTKKDGVTTPDAAVIGALGLKARPKAAGSL
ncbi:MAG: cellulase family glycosylhydrolase [Acidobacteriaceae bacterium]